MSAEILRRAAALMRNRANDIALGPWTATPGDIDHSDVYVTGLGWNLDPVLVATAAYGSAAEHIASWHPAVALAVADWLDETAADLDALMTYGGHAPALAVARAYLGES